MLMLRGMVLSVLVDIAGFKDGVIVIVHVNCGEKAP